MSITRADVTLQAEQDLLGAVMFDRDALDRLREPLAPEAFAEPAHQRVWAVAVEFIRSGRRADPTAVMHRLAGDNALIELGGLRYLADLIERAPPAAAAADMAAIVQEQAHRRALADLASVIAADAKDPSTDPFSAVAKAERGVAAILQAAAPDAAALVDARAAAQATVRRLDDEAENGRPRGALTGLRCFDRRLNGLRPGYLIVLAGRPSMGKTALARAAAMGCARRNPDRLVPFFTLEMDRDEISERSLSQLSFEADHPIAYHGMDGHRLPPEDRALLDQVSRRIPSNFILDDTPLLTVEYVRRRLLSLRKRAPIAAAFIDYLQIMGRPARPGSNDAAIIGEMTAALKRTAREVGCAIVLLSQLSRQVEQRENKRPMLSDLRESGAIEQDANVVLYVYREAYYLEREGPRKGVSDFDHQNNLAEVARLMEVICAKQRKGPIGTDKQRYFAEFDVVEDWPE